MTDSAPERGLKPRTPLGTTAMILGWVGVATCGVLSPLAILVGLAALRHAPRRHAAYGVMLGLAGLGLFFAVVTALARATR